MGKGQPVKKLIAYFELSACVQQKKEVQGEVDDSTQVLQYLSDVKVIEAWLSEREPLVLSTQYGRDSQSTQASDHFCFFLLADQGNSIIIILTIHKLKTISSTLLRLPGPKDHIG